MSLHRQADIYARSGVEIDRSVMAGWIGRLAGLLEPLSERIERLESAALSRRTRYFKRSLGGQSGRRCQVGATKLALEPKEPSSSDPSACSLVGLGQQSPRLPFGQRSARGLSVRFGPLVWK